MKKKAFRVLACLIALILATTSLSACADVTSLFGGGAGQKETEKENKRGTPEKEQSSVPSDSDGSPSDGKTPETPKNYDRLVLAEYEKGLDYLEDDVEALLCRLVHGYTAASFAIENLGHIGKDDLTSPATAERLDEAMAAWGELLDLAALSEYVFGKAAKEPAETLLAAPLDRDRTFGASSPDDALEWAKAVTAKYDSIKGNQKLRELADYMGTDAKRAYQTLEIAQNVLRGEYASEEGRAEEWLAVLNATKTASKVGVYLCATAVTCGATGAVGTAATLTSSQTAGIIVGGVDCVLTLGSEGANIILGEESGTAKCLSTVADVYSKCTFVYGFFNSPETVGEKIAFISDAGEMVNKGVSYFFGVDPLGDGGRLITRVIDSSNRACTPDAVDSLGLGGAYNNPESDTTADEFLSAEEEKLSSGNPLPDLGLSEPEKEQIINDFKTAKETVPEIVKTENGLSYRTDCYHGYCYLDKNGYLDGEKVQYAEDSTHGKYVVMKWTYSHGVQTSYKFFAPDGLLIQYEYVDSLTGMMVTEVFYDENVESDLNPQIRGNRSYIEYRSVTPPDREKVEKSKETGCSYQYTGYAKTVRFERLDDTLTECVYESMNGVLISEIYYATSGSGDRYVRSSRTVNEDGNDVYRSFYEDGRVYQFQVTYPDGQSDAEWYSYGADEKGSYRYITYFTNGNQVGVQKVYDDPAE